MKSKLSDICSYRNEKIAVAELDRENYISTENMLPDKNGVTIATSLPKTIQTQKYDKGDILVSNIRPYFKKIWFADKIGGCSNDVLVFKAKNRTDPRYLYYVLANDPFFEYSMATAKGTKMPRGDKKALMEYKVPDYDLKEQNKIAGVLSAIDDKIQLNNKINKNLLNQSLAFFRHQFIDTEYPSEQIPLYEFADYINGSAFKPNELGDIGLPVIKIAELKSGITDTTKHYSGIKDEKYLVFNRDILFSWSGNPETSIDVFIWSDGNGILNQHTFNVKSKFGCQWFTYLLLKYYKPIFTKVASNKQTTGLGHITAGDLKRLRFPFNIKRITDFEDTISPFMELYYSHLLETHTLRKLRDTLLPNLMSGEIDVTDINF